MKKAGLLFLILIMFFTFVACTGDKNMQDNNPLKDQTIKLQPFNLSAISLTENSEFKNKLDWYINYYLGLEIDDIMYDLRLNNGLDTKGGKSLATNPNNWYAAGKTMHGYWLWAYSRLYNYTGDESIKEKANYFANSLYEVFKKNPYSFCTNVDYYSFEKYLNGILENYKYCNNQAALQFAKELITHANEIFSRERLLGNNGDEWYTTAESLYKYIEISGDRSILKFASEFEYSEWWDIFARGENVLDYKPKAGMFSTHFHAFSHVNSLSGAAMAYKAKEAYYYYEILDIAYKWLKETQMMATGGLGPWYEHLLSEDEIITALTGNSGDSTETQCTSYAISKLNDYMMQFSGQASYGDWTELLLWNIIMGNIPIVDGQIMYYADYETTGGEKKNRPIQWTCCCGSCLVNMTNAIASIYYNDTKNIYVNQFVSSSVEFDGENGKIKLTQETQFPYDNKVKLTISEGKKSSYAIKIRKPEWINGEITLNVNGKKENVFVDEKGWIVVDRKWEKGDNIEISLPISITKSGFNSTQQTGKGVYALSYGPIALVANISAKNKTPSDYLDYETAESSLTLTDMQLLEFSVSNHTDIKFKPYYLEEIGKNYFMYMEY